jgi:hypothetical protein
MALSYCSCSTIFLRLLQIILHSALILLTLKLEQENSNA